MSEDVDWMPLNSNPPTILTLQGSRIPSSLSIQPVISWVGNVTSALTKIGSATPAASFSHPMHSTPLAAPCDHHNDFQCVDRIRSAPMKTLTNITRVSKPVPTCRIWVAFHWDLKKHLFVRAIQTELCEITAPQLHSQAAQWIQPRPKLHHAPIAQGAHPNA